MPVEITEEELAAYQRAVGLIKTLESNPASRDSFEASIKAIHPNVRTTAEQRDEALKPVNEKIDAVLAKLAEREEREATERKEREEREIVSSMETAFGRLRDRGLTEEGETKVRELMKARNIFDPEAAFALFESQNPKPPQENAAWVPDRWNYQTDITPDAKAWFTNPDKAESDTIGQVLLEMRRGNDA